MRWVIWVILTSRIKDFQETHFTKIAQNTINYWKQHHVWSSRHSCPPQIQLESKRTGAVLMRRMKDYQETYFTKLAQNDIQYWNKHPGRSSRHSCPPQIQLQSKRTGAVLMRRMKDSWETHFTKVAQNTVQYWYKYKYHGFSSCKIMQYRVLVTENHEKQCNSCKIMQNHAKSCKIIQNHAWYS